jgi:hypothetical protein
MATEGKSRSNLDQSEIYQIRVKGHLGAGWEDWFEGLTVLPEAQGETMITGPLADQAALHALLKKVRDLGMPLISVNSLKPGPESDPTNPPVETP